ncbi:M4 family metallopeptidase [Rhodococcus fascians]|uniref:M4 family metallopeptidase n=1 Tax=Rhodococcoides fascians TaxID=1828 RepID=UPI001C907D6E|nr:M4 family metallopeptidase [Rhodococcus fascians]MBY3792495.1 M4 family metallopeptidase [Rhodococcus fascians]MBY3825528.1 M4 family metallopeptidase [Rhodococcus fascians]MBY3835990.1 M4 family metallopeptidase [Rhodococcus fascians]MBY3865202.1 M4 family metallopeptidase [Rhodococcus fascians]MBY3884396.1 M4 family metallopeptidase [Rhodococcus fascians]
MTKDTDSGSFRRLHSHGVVPPFLLERLQGAGARATLLADREMRAGREVVQARTAIAPRTGGTLERTISDAKATRDLPGQQVRAEGEDPTGDAATDEAYDGLGATYLFFDEVYGYSSLDGSGLPLDATVHYGRDYDNAFWDGSRMVFGDGDGEVFARFTVSLGVIAHELAHGFTQYTTPLEYKDQAGALNESISDVFGALVEQYTAKQNAEDASWLIGEGLFLPAVQGKALRSLLEPGTAYDDDVLGKDPQPASMDDFVVTTEDDGGVHINSGIPNRAFAVAATTLGGPAWDRVGQVWFDTMTVGGLAPTVDFAGFSAATLLAAQKRFGADSDVARAVATGWSTVGVQSTREPSDDRV